MTDPPLRQVKETLGTLPAALADITTQVDHLTHSELRRWALSAKLGTRAGENPSAAPSACCDPLPRDDPPHPQMPAQPVSSPREVQLTPSQHNSVDINLPTKPAPSTQPHLNTGSSSNMDAGSIDPGPNPAPEVASSSSIASPPPRSHLAR